MASQATHRKKKGNAAQQGEVCSPERTEGVQSSAPWLASQLWDLGKAFSLLSPVFSAAGKWNNTTLATQLCIEQLCTMPGIQ
jgi:hypothetical protein